MDQTYWLASWRDSAADPGKGEYPRSHDVLALLRDGVTADKDGLRAAAFVADVRIEGGDAIRVELEHSDNVAIVVLVPYSRSRLRKSVKLGDMQVQLGDLRTWDAQPSSGRSRKSPSSHLSEESLRVSREARTGPPDRTRSPQPH